MPGEKGMKKMLKEGQTLREAGKCMCKCMKAWNEWWDWGCWTDYYVWNV